MKHELREKSFEFSAICNDNNHAPIIGPMNVTGYDLIPHGKSCSAKGSIFICLYDKFKYTPKHKVNKSSIWEGQFINVYGGGLRRKLILGNIYRPPCDVNENYKTFTNEIEHVLSNLVNKSNDVIISGDTNIDLLKIKEQDFFLVISLTQ